MEDLIFVQIASYRDSELLPTVMDCLQKARKPNNLRFAICWQFDESENIHQFEEDSRFKVVKIPYQASRGVCWARRYLENLYAGEAYTLQIDSHTRFIENWDEILIKLYESLSKERSILTTYPAPYIPGRGPNPGRSKAYVMAAKGFNNHGGIQLFPQLIKSVPPDFRPIRSRFISGGFFFTIGKHCFECPHDPDIYFEGEELHNSIVSHIAGYDFFHPVTNIVWHYYKRSNYPKHWTDHILKTEVGSFDPNNATYLNEKGLARFKAILTALLAVTPIPGKQSRSIHSYQKFAGIDFKNKKISAEALQGSEPPLCIP